MDRQFLLFITTFLVALGISENSYAYEYYDNEYADYNSGDKDYSPTCCDGSNETCPWVARLEVAGAVGQFIGQKHNYVELGLFGGPAPMNDWFFFADVRGYWLERHHNAASAGGGVRMLDRSTGSSRIWGANIYYDYMEGKHKGFNQIGVGLESLGACLDFRVNAYFPIESQAKSSSSHKHIYPGNFFWESREKEFSYKGVDGEVGYRFWQYCDFTLYGAAGPYYYHSKGPHHNIYGGQFRVEGRYLDYILLEGRFSDDNRYHAQFQGKLTLSLPLDRLIGCLCGYDRCRAFFTQPVKRNGLAFFDHCCDAKWNW